MIRTLSLLLLSASLFSIQAKADDMYPCNLSLKRPVANTSSPSNPTPDNSGSVSSTLAGVFYARAYVEDRTLDASNPMKYRWMTVTASGDGSWQSLFSSSNEFQYTIQQIQFPESLESLGVSYQVGFCYLGPVANIDPSTNHDSTEGAYDFVGTLSTGSSADYIPYTGLVTTRCDLRGTGANKGARLATELYPTAIDTDMQFSLNLGQLSSSESSFDSGMNSISNQVPRFCKINVEVDENSTGIRPSQLNLNEAQITLQIDKNLR